MNKGIGYNLMFYSAIILSVLSIVGLIYWGDFRFGLYLIMGISFLWWSRLVKNNQNPLIAQMVGILAALAQMILSLIGYQSR